MSTWRKVGCCLFAALAEALACFAEPGLYQKSLSGSFNTTDDPSIGGVVVPGALLASTHTSSYTYNGKTYSMNGNTTFAYKGYMFFKGGVTYNFVKRYDDSGLIRITRLDGTQVSPISSSTYSQNTVYGNFTPEADGCYCIDLRVGNGSGGMGPDASPFNKSDKLAAGLAWNTNGVTTCTDDNWQSWRKFMNTDEDVFLYTKNPEFTILPVTPVVIDGVHPVWPKVVVSNLLTSVELKEGVDFDVRVDAGQALPGAHAMTVSNCQENVAGSRVYEVPYSIRLASTAKRPRLPEGYAASDWIATSKTRHTKQYLDTGYKALAGTRVECDCYVPSAGNIESYECLWGSRADTSNSRKDSYFFFVRYNGGNIGYGHPGERGGTFGFPYNQRLLVLAEGSTVMMINGATTNSFTISGTPVDCGNTMAVFNFNNGDSNTAATLYSFRMLDDDSVSCWMVPCTRLSDGLVGAFDVARLTEPDKAFHGHTGSPPFTKGADLVEPAANDGELDFFVTAAEESSLAFAYSVNTNDYVGGTVKLEWSKTSDFAAAGEKALGTADDWGADTAGLLEGLDGRTTYYLRLTLSRAGLPDIVRTITADTLNGAGVLSSKCELTWESGIDPRVGGEVTVYGSGEVHTARVLVGETENPEEMSECGSLEVPQAGAISVSFKWPYFFRTAYYCLSYETAGGICYSAVKQELPSYSANYSWKASVADGDWTNGANWTISSSTVTNPTHPYPDGNTLTAVLPSGTYAIHMPSDIVCRAVQPNSGARATLVGDGDAPSHVVGSMLLTQSDARLTLDNVAYFFTGSLGSGMDHVAGNTWVRLQNNSSLTNSTGYFPQYFDGAGSSFEAAGGSAYRITSASVAWVLNGGHALLDDSLFENAYEVNLNTSGGTASTWTFTGAAPELKASGVTLGGAAGANLVFDLPSEGFAEPSIRVTSGVMFSTCAGPVTVRVPDTSMIWRARKTSVSQLIVAPAGINTNKVVLVPPKRDTGTFVWQTTDGIANPTGLSFVRRLTGTVLFVR